MEARQPYFSNNCTLYPGEYIPMLNATQLKVELKKFSKKNITEPSVNVTESADHFKLEVAIPGIRREDFFLSIDNNVLTLTVLHRRIGVTQEGRFQLHEFDYDCFKRHVILPENVETEFVRAEYREGILTMYLPKTTIVSKHGPTQVIVY